MPERKGVLNIVDRHPRRRNAKAKRFLAEISSASSQKFREQRNRAPFRQSAPGPILFSSLVVLGGRAQSYARQSFQNLSCAFAQLFRSLTASSSLEALWPARFASP